MMLPSISLRLPGDRRRLGHLLNPTHANANIEACEVVRRSGPGPGHRRRLFGLSRKGDSDQVRAADERVGRVVWYPARAGQKHMQPGVRGSAALDQRFIAAFDLSHTLLQSTAS